MSYDLNTARLILCRTGSMTLYSGDLKNWSGSHKHPNDTGEAGEAWNFMRTIGDRVYGYVQNGWDKKINIKRLGAHPKADRVEGVTVVWCSRRPDDKRLTIHGWYENAVVYQSNFGRPDSKGFGHSAVRVHFETQGDNAHLLEPAERIYEIPSRQKKTIGHADIFYADEANPALAAKIRSYLRQVRKSARSPAPRPGLPPDYYGWGGGESAQHLALKLFVRNNPACLDLGIIEKGEDEYILPSLDGIDVIFKTRELNYAVEVKPRNCGESEHLRGLYQGVKYRALMEAESQKLGNPLRCVAVLVTEDQLSEDHAATAALFNIVHRQIRL